MSRKLFIIGLLAVLSCSRTPPVRYFTVDVTSKALDVPNSRQVLYVQPFTGAQMYKQDRLIFKPSPHEITFDHYRRWISPPVVLTRQRTIDYVRSAALFDRVCTELIDVPDCLVLACRVTRFEEVKKQNGHEATAGLWVEISRWPQKNLLWQGELLSKAAVSNVSTESIVTAMGEATENVLAQLVEKLGAVRRDFRSQ